MLDNTKVGIYYCTGYILLMPTITASAELGYQAPSQPWRDVVLLRREEGRDPPLNGVSPLQPLQSIHRSAFKRPILSRGGVSSRDGMDGWIENASR